MFHSLVPLTYSLRKVSPSGGVSIKFQLSLRIPPLLSFFAQKTHRVLSFFRPISIFCHILANIPISRSSCLRRSPETPSESSPRRTAKPGLHSAPPCLPNARTPPVSTSSITPASSSVSTTDPRRRDCPNCALISCVGRISWRVAGACKWGRVRIGGTIRCIFGFC